MSCLPRLVNSGEIIIIDSNSAGRSLQFTIFCYFMKIIFFNSFSSILGSDLVALYSQQIGGSEELLFAD